MQSEGKLRSGGSPAVYSSITFCLIVTLYSLVLQATSASVETGAIPVPSLPHSPRSLHHACWSLFASGP